MKRELMLGLCGVFLAGAFSAHALPIRKAAWLVQNTAPGTTFTETPNWYSRFSLAQEEAIKVQRPILLVFSGSDWCNPCKMLDKKVFKSKVFREFATDNLVLLKADFPRRNLSSALAQDAAELAQKYPFEGFPTIMLLSPDGKVLSRMTGYSDELTPELFIQQLLKTMESLKK